MVRWTVDGKLFRLLFGDDLKLLVIRLVTKEDLESALDSANLKWSDTIKSTQFLRFYVALVAKELADRKLVVVGKCVGE